MLLRKPGRSAVASIKLMSAPRGSFGPLPCPFSPVEWALNHRSLGFAVADRPNRVVGPSLVVFHDHRRSFDVTGRQQPVGPVVIVSYQSVSGHQNVQQLPHQRCLFGSRAALRRGRQADQQPGDHAV